jgi:hypothetical protein
VLEGSCSATEDGCISSPNWPASYGNGEHCTIVAGTDVSLVVQSFVTEANFDVLSVDGVGYSGSGEGLEGLVVHAAQFISWVSDSVVYDYGWHICSGGTLPWRSACVPCMPLQMTFCVPSVAAGLDSTVAPPRPPLPPPLPPSPPTLPPAGLAVVRLLLTLLHASFNSFHRRSFITAVTDCRVVCSQHSAPLELSTSTA